MWVWCESNLVVIEERRKRRLAEKRLVALDKKSRDLVCHYDNCFIVLAKEVSFNLMSSFWAKGGREEERS